MGSPRSLQQATHSLFSQSLTSHSFIARCYHTHYSSIFTYVPTLPTTFSTKRYLQTTTPKSTCPCPRSSRPAPSSLPSSPPYPATLPLRSSNAEARPTKVSVRPPSKTPATSPLLGGLTRAGDTSPSTVTRSTTPTSLPTRMPLPLLTPSRLPLVRTSPSTGDCAKVDKTSLEFFKIHQAGLLDYRRGRFSSGSAQEQTGYWGTDAIFYDQGNSQSVTIPSDIPNGNYVLRTEVMSVHNNGAIKNRQFWPQAFNIKITGGDDSAQVPAGKLGTELYNDSDALLKWDIYWHKAGETIKAAPGPSIASALFGKVRRHARDFSA